MRRDDRPYHGLLYDLGDCRSGGRITLAPIAPGEAETLGAAFAAMDPWAAYGAAPGALGDFFAAEEDDCSRRAIRVDDELAGAVVIRSPWLHGPYLQFLGLLPGRQGAGVGTAVLDWMAREAPPGTRNLWLCVSVINARARAFYAHHGYTLVAELPALAADHMDELLFRRRVMPAAANASA